MINVDVNQGPNKNAFLPQAPSLTTGRVKNEGGGLLVHATLIS